MMEGIIRMYFGNINYYCVFFLHVHKALCASVRKAEGPGRKPELWIICRSVRHETSQEDLLSSSSLSQSTLETCFLQRSVIDDLFRADPLLIIREVRHMGTRIATAVPEMFNFHILHQESLK